MSTSVALSPILKWSIGFFLVALLAGVLGFGGIAGAATGVAQILFLGFVVLAAITLVVGLVRKV